MKIRNDWRLYCCKRYCWGFLICILLVGAVINVTNTTYTDGQIDALYGNNIKVEKVENEIGESV